MSLIKCPECGREISDEAIRCPSCGYPLKAEQKKKEKSKTVPQMSECPECHNMVDLHYRICPCCGYTLRNKSEVLFEKMKNVWESKKGKALLFACMTFFVVIGVCMEYKYTHNEFTQYTKYIGGNYKKLPKEMEHKDVEDDNDTWLASTGEADAEICDIDGLLLYSYSKLGMSEYGTKADYVYGVEWDAEDISKKDSNRIKEKLVKIYGNYDKKEVDEWPEEKYLDVGEKYTTYSWEDKKGLDISFTIHENDEKIDEAYIDWRKVKK